MVTALLKFTQGLNVGDGQALKVASGVAVDIDNHDDTNVDEWTITLLYSPPGSALMPGVLGTAISPTPHVVVTPDVVGSYRIQLEVVDALGNVDVDIRVFAIPTVNMGLLIPPYQHNPEQIPLALKPDELNFGGQAFGWQGDANPARVLMYQLLLNLDAQAGGGWVTALDLNFSTLANQAIPADGAVVVGGVAFTKANTAGDRAALAVVNGAGLRFQPTAGGASSIMELALTTLLPVGARKWPTSLRIWIWLEGQNFNSDADSAIVSLSSPGAALFEGKAGILAGNGQQTAIAFLPTTSTQVSNNAHPPGASTNVLVLDLPAIGGIQARVLSGQYAAGWPTESTALFESAVAEAAGGQWQDPTGGSPTGISSLNILLLTTADGASAALTVTIGRLRVDYKV